MTSADPDKIEEEIARLVPEGRWTRFSDVVTFHGRYVCKAGKPLCPNCLLNQLRPTVPRFCPGAEFLPKGAGWRGGGPRGCA